MRCTVLNLCELRPHGQLHVESFQEYVLISQDSVLVEVFFKPKNTAFWYYQTYKNIDEVIELKSIDAEISLADIYYGLEFQ